MTVKVFHAHLWGKREAKYATLKDHDVSTIKWTEVEPESPFYLFIPRDKELAGEYQQGWRLPDIFPVNVLGFQTHRDHFAIAFSYEEMERRTLDMRNSIISDDELHQKYNLKDNRDWKLSEARKTARTTKTADVIKECLYRPFDLRPCYFSYEAMDYPRRELMDHVMGKSNLCLNVCRQTKAAEWRHAIVSDKPTPAVFVEIKDGSTVMPLYVYPAGFKAQGDLLAAKEKQPNLAPEFVEALSEALGLPFDPAAHRGLHTRSSSASSASPAVKLSWTTSQESEVGRPQGGSETRGTMMSRVNPEDLFCYAYAVFYSPTYRERYAEFLKIDFPRLPLTSDAKLFFTLADLGEELVRLHLMRSPKLNNFITSFLHSGSNEVEKLRYEDGNVWLNKDQCFEGVEEADWNFHIGGYQVLAKWLKDRKRRKLSFDDIEHYQKMVIAIHETRRLMAEIDAQLPAEHPFGAH